MRFTKMNGAGNDFIIINNIEEQIPQTAFSAIARTLCERHLSIGADGMMFVEQPSSSGDYSMRFYNSDGSLGEMCGNGARCIARYGYEKGLAGKTQKIEATAGMVTGRRISKQMYEIRLNDITKMDLNHDLSYEGKNYKCSYVELGNPGLPHAVVEYRGLKNADRKALWSLGNAFRHDKSFPKGANVNFYDRNDDGSVQELTFERGVEDFTYACGTGTGSVVAVLTVMGMVDGNNTCVHIPDGELLVTIKQDDDVITDILLTGPTNIVAEGFVLDEELNF